MVDNYADIIAMRHYMEGAARVAAEYATAPVINAGDGGGPTSEHPTQALIDIYTIRQEKGKIDGLKVAIAGNILNIRVLHSMAIGLAKYDVELILTSPAGFEAPESLLDYIKSNKAKLVTDLDLEETIREADVLDVDIFLPKSIADYSVHERHRLIPVALEYTFGLDKLRNAKKNMILLHSLARTHELGFTIPPEVDKSPHARYFQEAANGPRIRMALLNLILG
jgi:aspartate carbamoyltransferase catalytic subunit